jgi:hypothetical protein
VSGGFPLREAESYPRVQAGVLEGLAMVLYYESILGYLKEEKLEEAFHYYEKWKTRGLLSEEEIETLAHLLPERSRIVSREAIGRMFQKNRPFTEEELYEMTETVDQEMKVNTKWNSINDRWIKA